MKANPRFAAGTVVRARGRQWMVLGGSRPEAIRVRPLAGSNPDSTWIQLALEPAEISAAPLDPQRAQRGPPPLPAAEAVSAERIPAGAQLRAGVEAALLVLGRGFLQHPANTALRKSAHQGTLTPQAFFHQLLRLVYRLIFLLTTEDRHLLHPPGTSGRAAELYAEGYSIRRLRERCRWRGGPDHFFDLWEGMKPVFRGLELGEPALGLPALAGLFASDRCPALDAAQLENQRLLTAIFRLGFLDEDRGLARFDWRGLDPQQLGGVYESLLELVPRLRKQGRELSFASAAEARGHARKTGGSYYTPGPLVQALLDSALEPVVRRTIAANPGDPAEALLQLSIVDPACGSGHFLLAAARRLAAHLAKAKAEGTPSAAESREALRQVVGRCIFGVDLDPMAIELCRLALWIETAEPGRPLSSLDSRIQQGNALLGSTPELMKEGVPDRAWSPIEGDAKTTAAALKRRNRAERRQRPSSEDPASGASLKQRKLLADAWCAAFFWPKPQPPGPLAQAAPTDGVWRRLRDHPRRASPLTVRTVESLARSYQFFHWHLAFPRVFAKGGFDVVLGNPPWERVKLQQQEFFASRSAAISGAENASIRKKLIAALPKSDPGLWTQWCDASRAAAGQSHFARHSGRYPRCGRGDVNTYALFAEHNRALLSPGARAGFIVPTGLSTDETTRDFFGALVRGRELASFFSFENEELVFPGVHHAFKFALLTIDRSGRAGLADLLFFARQVDALHDRDRHFSLSAADFATLNPNTGSCPTFRSRRDADLNLALYRRAGVLVREGPQSDGNPWAVRFLAMLHMANDSGLFRTRAELQAAGARLVGNRLEGKPGQFLPLIEAKMIHHFDHRFGTYQGQTGAQQNQGKLPELDDAAHASARRVTQPYYWVAKSEVDRRLAGSWERGWLLGWRDICRSTDRRTVIPAVIPRFAAGDTLLLAMPDVAPKLAAALLANLACFALDYASRQKVGGTHLKYHVLKQLPLLPPGIYQAASTWSAGTVGDWLLPRILELTYTAWDLEPFGRDVGCAGAPFRWDPARRFLLRAELDAAFFQLYGLSRDDAAFILDTFPIVKKQDEKAHGEYRTKRVILERCDALAASTRTGKPYQSVLWPPPADPLLAHPKRRPPA